MIRKIRYTYTHETGIKPTSEINFIVVKQILLLFEYYAMTFANIESTEKYHNMRDESYANSQIYG